MSSGSSLRAALLKEVPSGNPSWAQILDLLVKETLRVLPSMDRKPLWSAYCLTGHAGKHYKHDDFLADGCRPSNHSVLDDSMGYVSPEALRSELEGLWVPDAIYHERSGTWSRSKRRIIPESSRLVVVDGHQVSIRGFSMDAWGIYSGGLLEARVEGIEYMDGPLQGYEKAQSLKVSRPDSLDFLSRHSFQGVVEAIERFWGALERKRVRQLKEAMSGHLLIMDILDSLK